METEIFTCKYFKFGRNTTRLSQSHLRNFLACSIKLVMEIKCTLPSKSNFLSPKKTFIFNTTIPLLRLKRVKSLFTNVDIVIRYVNLKEV